MLRWSLFVKAGAVILMSCSRAPFFKGSLRQPNSFYLSFSCIVCWSSPIILARYDSSESQSFHLDVRVRWIFVYLFSGGVFVSSFACSRQWASASPSLATICQRLALTPLFFSRCCHPSFLSPSSASRVHSSSRIWSVVVDSLLLSLQKEEEVKLKEKGYRTLNRTASDVAFPILHSFNPLLSFVQIMSHSCSLTVALMPTSIIFLPPSSWRVIFEALETLSCRVRHLIVVLTVPILYVPVVWLENLLKSLIFSLFFSRSSGLSAFILCLSLSSLQSFPTTPFILQQPCEFLRELLLLVLISSIL